MDSFRIEKGHGHVGIGPSQQRHRSASHPVPVCTTQPGELRLPPANLEHCETKTNTQQRFDQDF
jgi:hypothetical protein